MQKQRRKYKVRLQRGSNSIRKRWKRTERNHRKWKLQRRIRVKGRGGKVWPSNRWKRGGKRVKGRGPRRRKAVVRRVRGAIVPPVAVSSQRVTKEGGVRGPEMAITSKGIVAMELVRKTKRVKRRGRKLTARKRVSTMGRMGGVRNPSRGKVKGWFNKARVGRKGRKRRYGGGQRVSKKRRGAEGRDRRKKQRVRYKETGKRYRKGLKGEMYRGAAGYWGSGAQERIIKERRRPVNNLRGKMERRSDRRRWRAGRVNSRRGGRVRMEKGKVGYRMEALYPAGSSRDRRGHCHARGDEGLPSEREKGQGVSSYFEAKPQSEKAKRTGRERVEVGDGRLVKEEVWKERKRERRENQYGNEVKGRNGRTMRDYRIVDYRVGARIVRREPRSGEVRMPVRRERSRIIRRK